jgi:hypothetical protein
MVNPDNSTLIPGIGSSDQYYVPLAEGAARIPSYDLDSFFARLQEPEAYLRIGLKFLGHNRSGIYFRINGSVGQMALKIMHNAISMTDNIPPLEQLIPNTRDFMAADAARTLYNQLDEAKEDAVAISEIIGQTRGSALAPSFVPPVLSILHANNHIAGYTLTHIPGDSHGYTINQALAHAEGYGVSKTSLFNRLHQVIKGLNDHGISVGDRNAYGNLILSRTGPYLISCVDQSGAQIYPSV